MAAVVAAAAVMAAVVVEVEAVAEALDVRIKPIVFDKDQFKIKHCPFRDFEGRHTTLCLTFLDIGGGGGSGSGSAVTYNPVTPLSCDCAKTLIKSCALAFHPVAGCAIAVTDLGTACTVRFSRAVTLFLQSARLENVKMHSCAKCEQNRDICVFHSMAGTAEAASNVESMSVGAFLTLRLLASSAS